MASRLGFPWRKLRCLEPKKNLTITGGTPIFSTLLHARDLKARMAQGRSRLYRVAFSWCHDAGLADDLVQEALIKGLKSIHQLKDETVLDAWLFSILNNCWRDHFRRQHPRADIEEIMELPADDPNPEETHAESQLVGRVRRAVAALPIGQRQVITLVDLEQMAYSETAEALGIPVGTVMSRLSRARQSLRELLHEAPVSLRVLTPKTRSGQ
jgi:RNA polymerase sigma-70 factor (ECF subfamily)